MLWPLSASFKIAREKEGSNPETINPCKENIRHVASKIRRL